MPLRFLSKTIFILSCLIVFSNSVSTADFESFLKNSDEYNDVIVDEVLSADYFRLKSGERIKMIGLMAAPTKRRKMIDEDRDEYGFPIQKEKEPTIVIEEEAYQFVNELLKGKHVRLEFDVDKKDDELHTLAYVFLLDSNIFVNAEILRQGFAQLHLSATNRKYDEKLREAYREAKREHRGLQNE